MKLWKFDQAARVLLSGPGQQWQAKPCIITPAYPAAQQTASLRNAEEAFDRHNRLRRILLLGRVPQIIKNR